MTIPFILTNGLLYFCKYDESKLLVIPQPMVPELLELYHAHELSAHMSRDRFYCFIVDGCQRAQDVVG